MDTLRINSKIINKSVLNDINKFKKGLNNSQLTKSEIDNLVKINFIYNQKFRFVKLSNNRWFDRFTKKHFYYTKKSKKFLKTLTKKEQNIENKRVYLRTLYLRMLRKKHILKISQSNGITVKEATIIYDRIAKKMSLKKRITEYGS